VIKISQYDNLKTVLLISSLPILLLTGAIAFYGVDVFIGDEWIIWANMLHELHVGNFSLADLMAQQNEQRLLSTRFFGLILDRNFGLNRFIACYFNVFLGITLFSLICYLFLKTRNELKIKCGYWPIVIISCLIFSFMQWETFFVGINNSILFPLVCLFSGFALLADKKISYLRFLLAILIGILGSFHTASGLFLARKCQKNAEGFFVDLQYWQAAFVGGFILKVTIPPRTILNCFISYFPLYQLWDISFH
jgi:hypothetical protein